MIHRIDDPANLPPRRPRSARPRPWAALALGLGICLGSERAEADIYRYVDSDGVIHFSNTKRKGRLVARKGSTSSSRRVTRIRPSQSGETDRYDRYIREAASLYVLPVELVRAVIRVESNFDPDAISHANAQGLMQLIPATAERMLVTDPFDPRQNILGGTRYLRVLANLFNGNLRLTLAAYNAGENAVIRYRGIPPYEETQNYVTKVIEHYNRYRNRAR